MKKRKQTTPLLSALTISMLCTSVAAAAGAHGTYQKYDTDGWSQPAIAVLMQGLANRDYPWSNAGSGNAVIPSANQPNPVDYMEPPEATASHTGNDAAGQTDAAASGSREHQRLAVSLTHNRKMPPPAMKGIPLETASPLPLLLRSRRPGNMSLQMSHKNILTMPCSSVTPARRAWLSTPAGTTLPIMRKEA